MVTSKKLPPRQWELDDLMDLGKREKGKADYLKAIPILILEKWVQEGRIEGEANHIRTKPFARRLEDCKLVANPFKFKGTSNILGALGAIQSDRNLTRPPLMNTDRKIGGSLINLPFYEPLLQTYRLKYQKNYPQDYKKLFPKTEPNWVITEEQVKNSKTETIFENSEMIDDVRNLFAPIVQTLRDRQKAIERLTKENEKLQAKLAALQNSPQGGNKASYRVIVDEELRSDCAKHLENSETYIDAIRRAGVVLEVRLRKLIGGDGQEKFMEGVALVDYALTPNTGKLIISDHPAEQDGVRMLFRGAVQFVRNPPAHKKVQYAELEAWQTISLIDYLLLLLRQAKPKPGK